MAARRGSFRNDGGEQNRWVRFELEAAGSNRDAVGATITLTLQESGATRTETRIVKNASGYASQSQTAVVFGLGPSGAALEARVRWPSGAETLVRNPEAGSAVVVREDPR